MSTSTTFVPTANGLLSLNEDAREDLGRLVQNMLNDAQGIVSDEGTDLEDMEEFEEKFVDPLEEDITMEEETPTIAFPMLEDVEMENQIEPFAYPMVEDIGMEEDIQSYNLVEEKKDEEGMEVDQSSNRICRPESPPAYQEGTNGSSSHEEEQDFPPPSIPNKKRKFRSSTSKPKEAFYSSSNNTRKNARERQGGEASEPLTEEPTSDKPLADLFLAATHRLSIETRQKFFKIPFEDLIKSLNDITVDY
jgi:hypothetical protein